MIERTVKSPISAGVLNAPVPAVDAEVHPARAGKRRYYGVLYAMLFAAYLALGVWSASAFGLISPDATASTGVASAVLWSRNPHYGALITALPPLTTALQVPLVWIADSVFGMPEYGAIMLAALASAASLFVIYKTLDVLGFTKGTRIALTLLFAANPLILLAALGGSSNALLVSCLLVSVYGLTCWWKRGQMGHLGLSGVAVTLAFLVSYWALLFVPLFTAAFYYGFSRQHVTHSWIRLTLFIMTPFYTLLFWLGLNFISMQDPLAFLNADTVYSLSDNPFTNATTALVYVLVAFFIVLVMLSIDKTRSQTLTGYVAFFAVVLVANVAAAGVLWAGQNTNGALLSMGVHGNLTEEQTAGDYVRDNLPANALVLLDRGDNFAIIENAGHPGRFVIQTDVDYKDLVANAASEVDYILVQKSMPGRPGTIEHDYPMLYKGKWLYAQLERDFGGEMGWRLYHVVSNAGK